MLKFAQHSKHSCQAYSIRLYQSTTQTYNATNKLTKLIQPLTKTEPINYILTTVKIFNNGISKLKVDFLNSLHIQQAELSRQHLLRKSRLDYEKRRQRLRCHEKHGIHLVDKDGKEVGFIPSTRYTFPKHNYQQHQNHVALKGNYLSTRRPQEHLRQITRDLQTTLPTVAAFVVLPGVGYAFLLLGMIFPRLLLSRQFHTREQRWEFSITEYGDRRRWFNILSIDFWGSCMIKMPSLVCEKEEKEIHQIISREEQQPNSPQLSNIESLSYTKMDAGGPVFNKDSMYTLYQLFQQHISSGHQGSTSSSSINQLQSAHLHHLALSNNLTASMLLPKSIRSTFLQTCLPNTYLQSKLITLAEDIIIDDVALIEEGQLDNACIEMTEEEVLDACWLRGLPVGGFASLDSSSISSSTNGSREDEVYQMRKILTNHLLMMKHVMDKRLKRELVRDSTLQLLVVHLTAIRYTMRRR